MHKRPKNFERRRPLGVKRVHTIFIDHTKYMVTAYSLGTLDKKIENRPGTLEKSKLVRDECMLKSFYGVDTFRREFARLGEIRSLLPPGVNVMALTATATSTLRASVMKMLSIQQAVVIAVSPNKSNIRYSVSPFTTLEATFISVVTELRENKVSMDRTIIFCRTLDDCASLYLFFKKQLGKDFLRPTDAPDLSQYCVVDMYTSCTHSALKNKIIQSFTISFLFG